MGKKKKHSKPNSPIKATKLVSYTDHQHEHHEKPQGQQYNLDNSSYQQPTPCFNIFRWKIDSFNTLLNAESLFTPLLSEKFSMAPPILPAHKDYYQLFDLQIIVYPAGLNNEMTSSSVFVTIPMNNKNHYYFSDLADEIIREETSFFTSLISLLSQKQSPSTVSNPQLQRILESFLKYIEEHSLEPLLTSSLRDFSTFSPPLSLSDLLSFLDINSHSHLLIDAQQETYNLSLPKRKKSPHLPRFQVTVNDTLLPILESDISANGDCVVGWVNAYSLEEMGKRGVDAPFEISVSIAEDSDPYLLTYLKQVEKKHNFLLEKKLSWGFHYAASLLKAGRMVVGDVITQVSTVGNAVNVLVKDLEFLCGAFGKDLVADCIVLLRAGDRLKGPKDKIQSGRETKKERTIVEKDEIIGINDKAEEEKENEEELLNTLIMFFEELQKEKILESLAGKTLQERFVKSAMEKIPSYKNMNAIGDDKVGLKSEDTESDKNTSIKRLNGARMEESDTDGRWDVVHKKNVPAFLNGSLDVEEIHYENDYMGKSGKRAVYEEKRNPLKEDPITSTKTSPFSPEVLFTKLSPDSKGQFLAVGNVVNVAILGNDFGKKGIQAIEDRQRGSINNSSTIEVTKASIEESSAFPIRLNVTNTAEGRGQQYINKFPTINNIDLLSLIAEDDMESEYNISTHKVPVLSSKIEEKDKETERDYDKTIYENSLREEGSIELKGEHGEEEERNGISLQMLKPALVGSPISPFAGTGQIDEIELKQVKMPDNDIGNSGNQLLANNMEEVEPGLMEPPKRHEKMTGLERNRLDSKDIFQLEGKGDYTNREEAFNKDELLGTNRLMEKRLRKLENVSAEAASMKGDFFGSISQHQEVALPHIYDLESPIKPKRKHDKVKTKNKSTSIRLRKRDEATQSENSDSEKQLRDYDIREDTKINSIVSDDGLDSIQGDKSTIVEAKLGGIKERESITKEIVKAGTLVEDAGKDGTSAAQEQAANMFYSQAVTTRKIERSQRSGIIGAEFRESMGESLFGSIGINIKERHNDERRGNLLKELGEIDDEIQQDLKALDTLLSKKAEPYNQPSWLKNCGGTRPIEEKRESESAALSVYELPIKTVDAAAIVTSVSDLIPPIPLTVKVKRQNKVKKGLHNTLGESQQHNGTELTESEKGPTEIKDSALISEKKDLEERVKENLFLRENELRKGTESPIAVLNRKFKEEEKVIENKPKFPLRVRFDLG